MAIGSFCEIVKLEAAPQSATFRVLLISQALGLLGHGLTWLGLTGWWYNTIFICELL